MKAKLSTLTILWLNISLQAFIGTAFGFSDQEIPLHPITNENKISSVEGPVTIPGVNLDVLDYHGGSTLHWATAFGFHEALKHLLQKSISLNKSIELETAPLEIAVHEDHVMARAKNGRIIKMSHSDEDSTEETLQKARDLYNHAISTLGLETNVDAEITHILNIYLSPGHAFVSIDSKEACQPVGFYPTRSRITNDYSTEYTIGSTVYGALFSLTYALKLLEKNRNHCLKILDSVVLASSISFVLSAFIINIPLDMDHQIGRISTEFEAQYVAEANQHLKVSFLITQKQAENVEDYIESISKDCEVGSPRKCTYHMLSRNCLTFAQEVFNAAGFKGNVFDYFSKEALNSVNYSSFDGLYDTKALLYAKLISKGILGSDSLIEVEV